MTLFKKTTATYLKSITFWGITISLYLVYAITTIVYSFFCFIMLDGTSVFGYLTAIALLMLLLFATGIIVLPMFDRRWQWAKKIRVLRSPLTISLIIFFCFLTIDIPVLENDYSEKDLLPSNIEAEESAQALNDLFGEDTPEIKIDRKKFSSSEFLSNIEEHEVEVVKAWESIAEQRNIINKLEKFEILYDLSPGEKIVSDMEFFMFTPLLSIQAIYEAYAILKIRQGNQIDGLRQFLLFHNVARKVLLNSTIAIHKMLFTALLKKNMDAIYFFSKMDEINHKDLLFMKDKFKILTKAEISIKRVCIGEYLFSKNCINEGYTGNTFGFITPVVDFLFYRKNKTIKAFKHSFNILIDNSEKPLSAQKALVALYQEKLKTPELLNLKGWVMLSIHSVNFPTYLFRVPAAKVKSEMLSMELNSKTGEPLPLIDYYTEKPYKLKREGTTLTTPGLDELFGTEDDITLGRKID